MSRFGRDDGAIARAEHPRVAIDVRGHLAFEHLVPLLDRRVEVLGENATAGRSPEVDAQHVARAAEAIALSNQPIVDHVVGQLPTLP